MARTTPPDRLPKLLDAAAAAFVEHGFQRSQMDDIAERLGVAKGTLYRSVDSKEALFAAVIRWSDDPEAVPSGGLDPSADLTAVVATVTADLAAAITGLELATIVRHRRRTRPSEAFGEEIERVTTELHLLLHRRRCAVMVLDRCAGEIPELGAVWFGAGRYALVDLWTDYLRLRARRVTDAVDHDVLARTVVEIITTWAVKMPWDPAPRAYPPDTAPACATMIRNLVMGQPR